jgi:predicted permease
MDVLFSVALPIFALIFVGYGAGRWHLLSAEGIAGINLFVYAFALPVMLFDKLSSTPFGRLLDGPFILAYLIANTVVFGSAFLLARRVLKCSIGDSAQHAMGATYGNTGYMGLPIVQAASGRAATLPMAVCMTLDMFFLMPVTMVLVSVGQGGAGQGGVVQNKAAGLRKALGTALAGLIANPMVLGIVLGAAVSAVGMPMPVTVRTFTALLGAAAGPCALFAIGATLAGQSSAQGARAPSPLTDGSLPGVALMAAFKLIVHPLVMWGLMAGVFSIDPLWVSVAILAAALPIASTVYVVAGRYRTYLPQVSAAILVSTAASVVTVSLVLTLLFGTG